MANPNGSYQDFGFDSGDETVSSGKFERFKAKEGETYRVSFVWWPMVNGRPDFSNGTPRFTGAKRFFIQNVGYILDSGPEIARYATQPSKMTVGTVLVIWPTNRKGEPDKSRLASDYDVKPWLFSGTIYDTLKTIHKEFNFGEKDLLITCTDTQYQKMNLVPCNSSIMRQFLASETAAAKSTVDAIFAAVKGVDDGMQALIARKMTPEQIREKLGGAPAGGGNGGGNTALDTAAVDDMIGDMLIE